MATLQRQDTILIFSGGSASYSFNFYAPLKDDIVVYVNSTKQTRGAEYTVILSGFSGGTVDFTAGNEPAASDVVTIALDPERTLTANFDVISNFNGANLNAALFRLLMIAQNNNDLFEERSLRYPIYANFPTQTDIDNNSLLPVLNDDEAWIKRGGIVTNVKIDDKTGLKGELEKNEPFNGEVNGATLVGFGFTQSGGDFAWTVNKFLNQLLNNTGFPAGAGLVGYSSNSFGAGTVENFLQQVESNSGASNVGTSSGGSVQSHIDDIKSNSGAGIVGTSSGNSVQATLDTNRTDINSNTSDITNFKSKTGAQAVGAGPNNTNYTQVQEGLDYLETRLNNLQGGVIYSYTMSADQSVSSNSPWVTVQFDTLDSSNSLNAPSPNASNQFAAPVTGYYLLNIYLGTNATGSDNNLAQKGRFNVNGGNTFYFFEDMEIIIGSSDSHNLSLKGTLHLFLNSGDTVSTEMKVSSSGSPSLDLKSATSRFSGHLIRAS